MQVGNTTKLSEEEIQERLAQYAKNPDPKIRDEIVMQYSNLVESISRRFLGACEPLEDLSQEGYIGLIRSVDKYDVDQGVKFSTYATHFIIGEIKHYLRDKGKIIKEPAWLQELNQKMTRVIESLNQKHNRQPTEKEIAEEMQMPESTVREMLTTREVFKVSSLDNGDNEDNSNSRDTEKISDQKMVSFQLPLEDKIVLETALDRLKDIEQRVISAHYYKGLNQTEIAKLLGISCNYVSHIIRNGTKKLKKILQTEEIRDTQMQRTLVSQRSSSGEGVDTSEVLDSLTGVYNRQYFSERLDEEVSRAYRDKSNVTLIAVNIALPDDLDKYVKMIRKDEVLYTVAQTMRSSIRKMDVISRFGEMSFMVILPHTGKYAPVVLDRLTNIINSIEVSAGRTAKISPTANLEYVIYPNDAITGRDLVRIAANKLGSTPDELAQFDTEEIRRAA